MRIEYVHRDAGCSYPVFGCRRCACIWHLPHSVRRNELAQKSCQAEAQRAGWTIPDEGPVYCPRCTNMYREIDQTA